MRLRAAAVARFTLLVLIVSGTRDFQSLAQSPGGSAIAVSSSSEEGLIRSAYAERDRGVTLFYTQHYRSDGKLVLLKGSLYAAITAFGVNQCKLAIGTTVVDHYAGQIGKGKIGDTFGTDIYSVQLFLTQEIADSLTLVEATPRQLESGTSATCEDGRACRIHWLELRAKSPVMHLTTTTNDVAGYDGFVKNFDAQVDQFRMPVSSRDAGKELISNLQRVAATCRP